MDACTLGWADLQSFQYQKITEDLKLKREKKLKICTLAQLYTWEKIEYKIKNLFIFYFKRDQKGNFLYNILFQPVLLF